MGAEFSVPQHANKSLPVDGPPAASPAMRTSKVLAFHSPARWKAHFEASKASSKLMVIDFSASWCVPCRTMEPVIEEFSAEYTDVEFIKLDVDELMGVAGQFGVQLLPTFVLVRKGIIVDKVTGVKREELQKKIEKHRSAS
ncbi:thioredoxin H2-like isoform X3 [Diospyros lotus]|uniref:thioredoxin H2-like isoform X3 n=1 Tax=Diospyros lotus TaxID=55363 RepID=UPI002255D836|nr:thioredoxin H2-like isoform X3 [Diospyros lotus]